MRFFKPLMFFILGNIAIMLSLSLLLFVLKLFGININSNTTIGLLILSAIIGSSSAIIGLLISKWSAKKTFHIETINDKNHFLYKMVKELANKANIPMPEVGIYEGPANAFATGPSKKNALIAVSTQLLYNLNEEELKGVLAHEIGHIKNGDMVSMTILEAILNTFVYFFAELITKTITEENEVIKRFLINAILQIVLGLFASLLAMWFSRYREYKADEASVFLNGKEGIKNALLKLSQIGQPLPAKQRAFGIIGFVEGLKELFRTHPPIEKRIRHIENLRF